MLLIIGNLKVSNLKKVYHNLIDEVAFNKHNTIYTNGNTNVTKINQLVKFNDNILLQRKYNIQII